MANTKNELVILDHAGNMERIKEEVIKLLTGQDPNSGVEFDYVALAKRTLVLLIAVYGIGRVKILRQLAFSIASTMVTRYLAQKAADSLMPVART